MNNEEKNLSQNDESVEIDNDEISELDTSDEEKKSSAGFLTLVITLVACVLVAVIMIFALLPKNNDNNGDNSQNPGEQGGNEDEGNDGGSTEEADDKYVITVVDENGDPVYGIALTLYVEGISTPMTNDRTTTGVDGIVKYSKSKNIQVAITSESLPSNFEYDKINQKLTPDADGKLTIVLKRLYYEVRVVDQDGNPIAGVTVQICAEVCKAPQVTNEEGKAYFDYDGTVEYHAQLTLTIPDNATPEEIEAILAEEIPGYTVADPQAYYYFTDKVTTITLTKIGK